MARGRWNGGIIGPNLKTTSSSASGIFSLSEAQVDISAGTFPQNASIPPPVDPYFYQNSILLHGDGSNGAQNNTFIDGSTNAFTITRNGSATQGTFSPYSQTGWSAYFSGTSGAPDWISTASSSIYNVSSGNWTIEAWFYNTSTDVSNRYITFTPASGTVFGLIPAGGNYFAINQFGSSSPVTTSASTVKLNQWSHVAIVKNGSTTYVYIDGVLGGSGTVSWSNSAHTIYFGGNGGSYAYNYNGWISNARIVMGTALYSGSTYTVPTAPLTAITNTQFLTLNNNRFYDSSNGNAVLLGVTTGPTVQAFSPFAPAAAYGVSSVGGSAYFNGTTDYLTLPYNSALDLTQVSIFTLEAWVYCTAFASGQNTIIGNRRNGSAGWEFRINPAGTVTYYHTGGASIVSTATVSLNTWNHIAAVRNGSTLYVCVNGVVTSGAISNGTATINIPAIGVESTTGDYHYGYISNLRILSGTALYTTTFTPPTAPVTAVSGTQLLINGTNAGIYDSTAKNVITTAGSAQISTSQSQYGGSSIAFNGSTDYITTPYTVLNGKYTGDFTVECWFWMNNTTGTQPIISQRTTNSTYCPYLLWVASGTLTLYVSSNNSSWDIINGQSLGTITAGQWYHYALVRSGSAIKSYLNGAVVGAGATSSATLDATSSNILRIGGTGDPTYFNGYIDDVRITTGYARYTSAFTPPTASFANQ